jgi:octaprenyl-diphosphate synthase
MLVAIGDMPIMSMMADATNVISEGEVQQMGNAGNSGLTADIYLQVIYRKTAKLFEAAAQTGASLAGVNQSAMADYGKHLGLAFQIADDVLDYQGDVDSIGKNVGDDLAEGKMTLPLIYTRDNSDAEQARMICQAIETKSAESFNPILALVKAKGGLEYSIGMAQHQAELAKVALAKLPGSIYKDVMLELADFSVARNI